MLAWRIALATAVLASLVYFGVQGVAWILNGPSFSDLLFGIAAVFGSVALIHFLSTLVLAFRYRAIPASADLPRLTVIVPAYNEGAAVRVALESALANDYPADKLEILAVDDGSKDDTWEHIAAVAAQHPDRVIAIRQPVNGGKREALRVGFLRATGDVVVTVDSDSKLHRTALRHIVAPIVEDPEVGAVAGRVLVLNREDGILTRLLSARFFVTFDLARAAQSQFGAVLCTPGALSAYRMTAVRRVLERWSTQRFLGQPCTIAEDRALTTWLLREGYRSVYQRTAVVETLMPTHLSRLSRMLVRWERGNIREDFVMLPVLFTRWRERDRWWPTFDIAIELVQYPIGWLGLGVLALRLVQSPAAAPLFFAMVLVSALAQTLYCLRSDRVADFFYGLGYALFAFVGLQWVFPYSLLTVRDGRWLTR
jgi:hyaluronan synthase